MHAINLQEAGDYMVEIRHFVECFGKVVCKAKRDVAREYRKLIHFMREMVLKIGAYGPVEHADEEHVRRGIGQCMVQKLEILRTSRELKKNI